MGYAIPVKVYEKLEEKLGKETAQIVVDALEISIKNAFEEAQERQKIAISEELKKELATKYDLKLVEIELRKEIDVVRKEIDMVRKEIELVRLEFKKDLRIVTIILLAAIILLNQNSLEFLAKLLGLMK